MIPLPNDYKPSQDDILCGRGKGYAKNPGNLLYLALVRSNLKTYVEAPKRLDKSLVVASVVQTIKHSGAKFIRQDKMTDRYFELSDEQIHEKTGHAIRDILKTYKEEKKKKREREEGTPPTFQDNKRVVNTVRLVPSNASLNHEDFRRLSLEPHPQHRHQPPSSKQEHALVSSLEPRPLNEIIISNLFKSSPTPLFGQDSDGTPNPVPLNHHEGLFDRNFFDIDDELKDDVALGQSTTANDSLQARRSSLEVFYEQQVEGMRVMDPAGRPPLGSSETEAVPSAITSSIMPAEDHNLFELFADEDEMT